MQKGKKGRIPGENLKTAVAVVPLVTYSVASKNLENPRFADIKSQAVLNRILYWSGICKSLNKLRSHSKKAGMQLMLATNRKIKEYMSSQGGKTLGHHAMVWVMLGYLADEAKMSVTPQKKMAWEHLSSAVNGWGLYLLKRAPNDRDYESLAGALSFEVAEKIFARSRRDV